MKNLKIFLITFLSMILIGWQINLVAKTQSASTKPAHTQQHAAKITKHKKQHHKTTKSHKHHSKHKKHSVQKSTPQMVFINEMVTEQHFGKKYLTNLFKHITVEQAIIPQIVSPMEAQPWYIYQHYFIRDARINAGVNYWVQHEAVLERAAKQYGVPPSIIVAILGVETNYGQAQGKYPVLNTLYTLAFYYPPRADFFRQQLKEYLILTRELKIDPNSITGSYAGAMGFPQFMPSSYRYYAVDYDGNHQIDLFHNSTDVIGSVANYFALNGWHRGEPVVVEARIVNNDYQKVMNNALKTKYTIEEYKHYGVIPEQAVDDSVKANLIIFKGKNENEYWLCLRNFYAITRYNPSPAYAMAVYQLADNLEQAYRQYKEDHA